MASTRIRRVNDALRREIEKGIAKVERDNAKPPKPLSVHVPPALAAAAKAAGFKDVIVVGAVPTDDLRAGLRNFQRSTTRALDAAGVPDHLQGGGQEEWDDGLE